MRAAVLTKQNFIGSHVIFTILSENLGGGGISVGFDQKLTQVGGEHFNPSILVYLVVIGLDSTKRLQYLKAAPEI
jgi:hypothetical protein